MDVWNSRADSNCMSRMKGAALTDFPRSVCLCVCVSACVCGGGVGGEAIMEML